MRRRWLVTGVVTAALLGAAPAWGAGFAIFEQGTRAMGLAGAFTAQADDPSLLFHNAGGLGLIEETDWSVGVTYVKGLEADFEGAPPFPGDGARAEQELLGEVIPHVYYVRPLGQTWRFGLGVNAPFGLSTEWKNPSTFSGRFVSTKAALTAIDLNPTLGWRLTPSFGLGVGAVIRYSDVELNRHIPQFNPFTQRVADVARLHLESDIADGDGYGWNIGVLHRYNNSFSWGFSYRSPIEIDYEGEAVLTQIPTGTPQFDALLRSRLPFDRNLPVATSIEFPDQASLGLLFAITPNLSVETDFNWTGWSTVDSIVIDFTGGDLPDAAIPEEWDDANSYRLGIRWGRWRFGYIYDETPQPEEAVSPLLPDANRNDITIGYGLPIAGGDLEMALLYALFDERERFRSFPGEGDFFGSYRNEALVLGITFTR